MRLGRIKGCVDREVRSETSKGSLRPPAGLLAPGCAYNRVQVHAVCDGIACREREKPYTPSSHLGLIRDRERLHIIFSHLGLI